MSGVHQDADTSWSGAEAMTAAQCSTLALPAPKRGKSLSAPPTPWVDCRRVESDASRATSGVGTIRDAAAPWSPA